MCKCLTKTLNLNSHYLFGIRQMLSLIWSQEKGSKEAVVDAYKMDPCLYGFIISHGPLVYPLCYKCLAMFLPTMLVLAHQCNSSQSACILAVLKPQWSAAIWTFWWNTASGTAVERRSPPTSGWYRACVRPCSKWRPRSLKPTTRCRPSGRYGSVLGACWNGSVGMICIDGGFI